MALIARPSQQAYSRLDYLQLEFFKTEPFREKTLRTKYRYSELEFQDSFRIMELCSLRDGDEIQIHLHHSTLAEAPPYETLSYEWGPVGNTERRNPITCDGCVLMITDNLKAALLRLRAKTLPRFLWVDAVCIDQENFVERGHQVGLMQEIYAQGYRVFVWLGEAGPHTSQAFDGFREAKRYSPDRPLDFDENRIEHNFILQALSRDSDIVAPFPGENAAIGIRYEEEIVIILHLYYEVLPSTFKCLLRDQYTESDDDRDIINRSYFGRMWIIQEVTHSKNIIVMCGKYEIDWMDLYRGSLHCPVCRMDKDKPNFLAVINCIEQFRRANRGERPPFFLHDLIRCFPMSRATEGRDNVYALWSVLYGRSVGGFHRDYIMSDAEAFTKIAKYFYEASHRSMIPFWHMWNCYLPPSMSYVPGKPSWVPDFGNHDREREPLDVDQSYFNSWSQNAYRAADGLYGYWSDVTRPKNPVPTAEEPAPNDPVVDGMQGLWFEGAVFEGRVFGICNAFSLDDVECVIGPSSKRQKTSLTPVDAGDNKSRQENIDFKSCVSTTWPDLAKRTSGSWSTDQLLKHKFGRQIFVSECGSFGWGPKGGCLRVGDQLMSHERFNKDSGLGTWAIRADPGRKDPEGNPVYEFIGPVLGWQGWKNAENKSGARILFL